MSKILLLRKSVTIWTVVPAQSFDLLYNEIQKKTIKWAIDRSMGTIDEDILAEPFTIVRGPPGTGKTHTLVNSLNLYFLLLLLLFKF
jgi:Cdc6-like AAA superfamily ATPase